MRFGNDRRPHGVLGVDRRYAEHGHEGPLPFVRLVLPGVGVRGLRMAGHGEHLHLALPRDFAPEHFAHILGAEMGRPQAVQVTDGSLESGHVGTHAAMSTRSATVMGLDATRASIAGEDTTRRPRSLDESANFR